MSTRAAQRMEAPNGERDAPAKLRLSVAEIIRETTDVVRIELEGDAPFAYRAGQHVRIDPRQFAQLLPLVQYLESVKKRPEPARPFSLSSAPHEQRLSVTVKEQAYVPGNLPPVLSPLLCHGLSPGNVVELEGFFGEYVLPRELASTGRHVLHVVAGSGLVPNYSIVKSALEEGLPLAHTLVCVNRFHADIPFRRELERLEARHPDRLRVVHLLTREPEPEAFGPAFHGGRISQAFLHKFIDEPFATEAFVCGPASAPQPALPAGVEISGSAASFLDTTVMWLEALGIPAARIHTEISG